MAAQAKRAAILTFDLPAVMLIISLIPAMSASLPQHHNRQASRNRYDGRYEPELLETFLSNVKTLPYRGCSFLSHRGNMPWGLLARPRMGHRITYEPELCLPGPVRHIRVIRTRPAT